MAAGYFNARRGCYYVYITLFVTLCYSLHNVSYPHFPQFYPQAVPENTLSNQGKSGLYAEISTALLPAVEISFVNIILDFLGESVEEQLGRENQLVLLLAPPVGVHPEAAVLQEVPA